MHMIDITGAIACHRHTNALALTAGVDSLDFLHPIKVGDIIILKSRVTCTFRTSLEVEVEVFSEGIQTASGKLTSHAYLTFVSLDDTASRSRCRRCSIETPEDEERAAGAGAARGAAGSRKSAAPSFRRPRALFEPSPYSEAIRALAPRSRSRSTS